MGVVAFSWENLRKTIIYLKLGQNGAEKYKHDVLEEAAD
jgi:hypothetical protein